ncbi:MAG: phosphate/phosphite/phosphonate ABC transporter substrate-binding protein [Desulforhopalus sp.]
MMKIKLLAITVTTLLFFSCICQAGAAVKFGVLAKNGPGEVHKKWAATGKYLTKKIGRRVEIVPLRPDQVLSAVKDRKVDFFLVNSSLFVTAKAKYNAVPVATIIKSCQGKALDSFGGVVFTTANNKKINSFKDLKGKKLAAVRKSSFDGYQVAYKEFTDIGMDPFMDLYSIEFSGTGDKVVMDVKNKRVDAGTVGTETLERMVASGAVAMKDFKIIGKQDHGDFPLVCSTQLYPEWPLAKVAATNDGLATKVVAALKELKAEHKAASSANLVGWTDPLDYSNVEALQQSLRVGAYAR